MTRAFEELGVARVAAATDLLNVASVAVLERLGMRRTSVTDDGAWCTAFYEIEADAWRRMGGAAP